MKTQFWVLPMPGTQPCAKMSGVAYIFFAHCNTGLCPVVGSWEGGRMRICKLCLASRDLECPSDSILEIENPHVNHDGDPMGFGALQLQVVRPSAGPRELWYFALTLCICDVKGQSCRCLRGDASAGSRA